MNITILEFESLESTNTEALSQARRGGREGLCIIAKRQTAGRGRLGRSWVSPENTGLYLSIILRPRIGMDRLPLLTLMTAVAVFETLRGLFDLRPDIKWPNDVHINNKKISGILAESAETSRGLAVVVGIGINLSSANFPPELIETATSIGAETPDQPDREELLRNLLKQFSRFYDLFTRDPGGASIRREWIARSSYAEGKKIRAVLENEVLEGITRGLGENGALRVEVGSGEIRAIQAGDIQKLR